MSRSLARSRLLGALLLAGLAGCGQEAAQPVAVNLVAINDFHGYIQGSSFRYPDPANPGKTLSVNAGGIATLGGMLAELRKQDPQLLFIGAGDLVGGSPPISAMWADEPSLEALKAMGLRFTAVGNHELDLGKAELLRQIHGGCESPRPEKACSFRGDYKGAGFDYLAANLVDSATGKPLLPAYRIEEVKGVKVAFVAAILRDVASVVRPSGLAGLEVRDEADSINALIPEIKAAGANAIVAVVHQGGSTPEPFDKPACQQLGGEIVDVAKRLDPAVDLLLSAHSHQGYLCQVGKLPVTQGSSYGHLLTQLTLDVTPGTHKVTRVEARNLLADPARYAPDEKLAALQGEIEARSNAVLARPIARLAAAEVRREMNEAGESAMGDLIADAQLAATRSQGAQLALMNPGGIRGDLALGQGLETVSYSQVAGSQPFNNTLHLLTLSGAQLVALLEQQWRDGGGFTPLQVSSSFAYQWDAGRPVGQRVLADSLRLDGQPVRAEGRYRVVSNAFLAEGGDGFSLFREGAEHRDSGISDLDALIDYLVAQDQAGTPAGAAEGAGRIRRMEGSLTQRE